jgi:hypothetical protein
MASHLQHRVGANPLALQGVPATDNAYLTVSGAYLLLVTIGTSLLFFLLLVHLLSSGDSTGGQTALSVATALVLALIHYLFMGSFYKILMAGELNGMGPRRMRAMRSLPMLAKVIVATFFGFVAALSITVLLQAGSASPSTKNAAIQVLQRIAEGKEHAAISKQYFDQVKTTPPQPSQSGEFALLLRAAWALVQPIPQSAKVNSLASLPYDNPVLWWLTGLCSLLVFTPLALVEFRRRSELVWLQQLQTVVLLAERNGFVEGKFPPVEKHVEAMERPHLHIYAKAILQREIRHAKNIATMLRSERRRWLQQAKKMRNES